MLLLSRRVMAAGDPRQTGDCRDDLVNRLINTSLKVTVDRPCFQRRTAFRSRPSFLLLPVCPDLPSRRTLGPALRAAPAARPEDRPHDHEDQQRRPCHHRRCRTGGDPFAPHHPATPPTMRAALGQGISVPADVFRHGIIEVNLDIARRAFAGLARPDEVPKRVGGTGHRVGTDSCDDVQPAEVSRHAPPASRTPRRGAGLVKGEGRRFPRSPAVFGPHMGPAHRANAITCDGLSEHEEQSTLTLPPFRRRPAASGGGRETGSFRPDGPDVPLGARRPPGSPLAHRRTPAAPATEHPACTTTPST